MGLTLRDRTNGHDDRVAGFAATWVDREIAGCEFRDARLGKRFRTLLERIGSDIGQSIPFVLPGLGEYERRPTVFLANHRVSEADILSGHFQSTRERVAATNDLVLVLHDTTGSSPIQRDRPELIGITKCITALTANEIWLAIPECTRPVEVLMHSSLAITTAGLPLGLCAVKFWTRDKFKGTAALKKKDQSNAGRPIEKKESIRWLENLKQSTELLDDPGRAASHIGDRREPSIYELFCTAQEVGTHFLVRTCVDRLAGDGDHTVADGNGCDLSKGAASHRGARRQR